MKVKHLRWEDAKKGKSRLKTSKMDMLSKITQNTSLTNRSRSGCSDSCIEFWGNQKIWLEVDEWNGDIVQDTMGKSTFICLDIIIYLSLRISK